MGDHFEKGQHALLNEGEENEMEIFGYRTQSCRKTLCLAGSIFSFGILSLVFYWKPAWHVWANCIPCSLQEADVVLLRTTDEFQTYSRKKVMWICLSALNSAFRLNADNPFITDEESIINRAVRKPDLKVRCIKVQKIRYVWDNLEGQFQKIGRLICGPNTIDVEIAPIWKLLIKEVLNPFYVFQLFSVCLWFSEDYKEYAFAIIIMSIISVALTVYDLREQSVKLHRLVEAHNNITVSIYGKNAGVQELESRFLVPGDLLILMGNKVQMPCDAILIDGSCVVNEGMLTGESIPVTKTPLPKMEGSVPWRRQGEGEYKRHVLFCGTEVIQAKGARSSTAKAVVLQTGFNTAKGDLVRSILYPKPMNFKLYRDAIRFLLCLVGTATIGMIYTLCVYVLSGETPGEVVKKALDVITIAVPPALPAALTTGIMYAQRRLKKRGIFCISPQRINVCGQLNLVCFDKVPVEGIAILHQFPFSSVLQRMTVIVQEMGGDQLVFMKGAPERVASFCQPETVPTSFVSELQIYTTQGFRVIGLAYKKLEMDHHISALMREQVESDLIFLGLLILENRLKEETKPVLEELISARIRTVMITGDNLQTAITVARKSGMVSESQKVILIEANETTGSSSASISWKLLEEKKHIAYRNQDNYINIREEISDNSKEGSYHFALNGKSFQVITQHFSSLLPKILMNGTIFARMSPGQKSSLVEEFQKLEEGRAALVTSFCMFKYMALYSMIQYVGVLLLYWETNNLSNYQFLFQDLAITTIIGVTMNLNGAYPKLVPFRPAGRLISPPLLLSVILNILLSLAMQIVGFILVQRQPWYSMGMHSACTVQNDTLSKLTISPTPPVKNGTNGVFTSFENTTIWFLGTINCIIVALVFSKGKPFRQPTYKNYIFVLVLVVQLSVCLFILFADIPELYRRLDLLCTPILWRVYIVIMLSSNFIVSLVVEEAIIENRALWMTIKRCFGYQSKSQYRIWQRALANDPSWPPINQTSYSDMPGCGRGVSYSNPVFESNEDQL
ncbi:hypothetical protein G4228_012716 [Cervus hanglu yarkandensis]|nr:hypothetical protein G4228_012716 [Cervus hanglu yarkandensis]